MSVYAGPADWWTDRTNIGRTHIATKGVVQTGLVFNLDAGVSSSYAGSGSTWNDLSANPINGTLSGGTFSSKNGGTITAGTATLVNMGNLATNSKLSLTQNFSIEQVFEPSGYQPSNYYGLTNQLLAKGTSATYNYQTQVSADNTVTFIKRTSGGEGLQYHSFTVPSMLGKVNVLTFVISSNTTVICYMNGSLIGSMSITGAAIEALANDPVLISWNGTSDIPFKGNYYSCRVYNIALTAAQVSQNFNALRGRYGI